MIRLAAAYLTDEQRIRATEVYQDIVNRNYDWYVSAIHSLSPNDEYYFIFETKSDHAIFVLKAL